MAMSKKHYVAIARIVRECRASEDFFIRQQMLALQVMLSNVFRLDNPKFDYERFAAACDPATKSKGRK